MPAIEARAEIFLMALRSLSKKEREQILTRLLEDEEFREDVLDIALYESRKDEPSRQDVPVAGVDRDTLTVCHPGIRGTIAPIETEKTTSMIRFSHQRFR